MTGDRRNGIHRNGCGDAADGRTLGVFGRLALLLKPAAENEVHGSLRVSGGMLLVLPRTKEQTCSS